MIETGNKTGNICITQYCGVRLIFIPPQLSQQSYTISERFDGDLMLPETVKVRRPSCKVANTCIRFQPNLDCLDKFSKKSPISNFMEIRPLVTALIRSTDGRGKYRPIDE